MLSYSDFFIVVFLSIYFKWSHEFILIVLSHNYYIAVVEKCWFSEHNVLEDTSAQ